MDCNKVLWDGIVTAVGFLGPDFIRAGCLFTTSKLEDFRFSQIDIFRIIVKFYI